MQQWEPQYKKCPGYCNGKGWYYLKGTLPHFVPCETCKGSGVVELTEDEILQAQDAERDHQADLMKDE